MQALARAAAERAYCPHFGEVQAGCCVVIAGGLLLPGSSAGTWTGFGGISPVAAALVALGARGGEPSDIVAAAWTATRRSSRPDIQRLREADRELLRQIAPAASLTYLDS